MKDSANDLKGASGEAYRGLVNEIPAHAQAHRMTPEEMFSEYFNHNIDQNDPLAVLVNKHDPTGKHGLFDYISEDLESFQ